MRYLAFQTDDPAFDWTTFDFDRDASRMRIHGRHLERQQPDLSGFRNAGGKLILFHGWNDPLISATRTIQYYSSVRHGLGRRRNEGFARLFLAPGMSHCGGGRGRRPSTTSQPWRAGSRAAWRRTASWPTTSTTTATWIVRAHCARFHKWRDTRDTAAPTTRRTSAAWSPRTRNRLGNPAITPADGRERNAAGERACAEPSRFDSGRGRRKAGGRPWFPDVFRIGADVAWRNP